MSRIVELVHLEVGQFGARDGREPTWTEALARAEPSGGRGIDQPGWIHKCPIEPAATELFLAGLLVAVEVL